VAKRGRKVPKTASGMKLRTMNDISAAAAVQLFHACMVLDDCDPMSLYAPIPEAFPTDIAARDFLECLNLYREMWSEGEASAAGVFGLTDTQREELVDVARTYTDEELKKVLTPRLLEVLNLLKEDLGRGNQEISSALGISVKTVKVHLTEMFKRLKVRNRVEAVNVTTPLLQTGPKKP
jgi:DNA-binding CsgD family transcriptional regulator